MDGRHPDPGVVRDVGEVGGDPHRHRLPAGGRTPPGSCGCRRADSRWPVRRPYPTVRQWCGASQCGHCRQPARRRATDLAVGLSDRGNRALARHRTGDAQRPGSLRNCLRKHNIEWHRARSYAGSEFCCLASRSQGNRPTKHPSCGARKREWRRQPYVQCREGTSDLDLERL